MKERGEIEREDERVQLRNDGVPFAPSCNSLAGVPRRSHHRSCEEDERDRVI